MLKGLLYFLLTVIVLALAITIYQIKKFWDNLSFEFKFDGNIQTLALTLASAIVKNEVDVPIKIIVDNNNSNGVTIKDLFVSMSYNGEEILKTKEGSATLQTIQIPANTKAFEIKDTVILFKNTETGNLINELGKGNHPVVDITVTGKLFGVQVNPFKTSFKYALGV